MGVQPGGIIHQFRQRFQIGGTELFQHPVFEDILHDGMGVANLFQNLVGGGALACGGLGSGLDLQLVEKNRGQLLAGADVEFLACVLDDRAGQGGKLSGHIVQKILERIQINADARLLHGD